MINIDDINNSLNEFIKDKLKGFFIINKTIIPNKSFKAIKECTIELWYLESKKTKNKVKVTSISLSRRVLKEDEDKINRELETKLLLEIFKFIDNKDYETIKI